MRSAAIDFAPSPANLANEAAPQDQTIASPAAPATALPTPPSHRISEAEFQSVSNVVGHTRVLVNHVLCIQ